MSIKKKNDTQGPCESTCIVKALLISCQLKISQEANNLINIDLLGLRPELLKGMNKVKKILPVNFNSGRLNKQLSLFFPKLLTFPGRVGLFGGWFSKNSPNSGTGLALFL